MIIKWYWWDHFKRPIHTLYTYAQCGEYPLDYPSRCEKMFLVPVRMELTGFNASVINVWWKNAQGRIVLVVHSTGR